MKAYLLSLFLILSSSVFSQQNSFDYENDFSDDSDTLLQIGEEEYNIWEVGIPEKVFFFGDGHTEPPSIMTGKTSPYSSNNQSSFEIWIGLESFTYFYYHFYIDFKHKLQTANGKDGGYVEISYDGGVSWRNIILDTCIFNYGELPSIGGFYTIEDTLFDGTPGFSGSLSEWTWAGISWAWSEFDYPWIAEDGIRLKLRFSFISDNEEEQLAGWAIDDIRIFYGWYEGINQSHINVPSLVYPNPIIESAILKIENQTNEKVLLQIFDCSGNIVQSEVTQGNVIPIESSGFLGGMYIYKIIFLNSEKRSAGKFLVED